MSFTGGNFTFGGGGAGRFSTALTRGRVQGASAYAVAYPSPFFDIAHTYLPTTVKQLFQFCRYYYLTNPLINAIIQKLSEYPVTDMIIDHEDKEVVQKWKEFFYETARIRPFQVECGLDYNTYGNAAVSLSFPFQKYLKCSHCGFNEQARRIRNHWTFTSNEFRLSCPKCGTTSAATPKDWYYRDASGIKPVRWNVEDIEINYNQITGAYTHFFTIPAPLRADITLGKKEVVEGMPQIFLQAIRQQKGVVFSKSNFFHLKRATIAWQDRGWGLPLVLPVLKDAFYLQIMKKAQEAILVEHIVPLRVLFPQAASGTADPFCVSPATLVETPSGLLPASEVQAGDYLRSHTGKWRKVEATKNRAVGSTEKVYRLGVASLSAFDFELSEDHPVLAIPRVGGRKNPREGLVDPEFIPVRDLRKGDYVAYPSTRTVRRGQLLDLADYVQGRAATDAWVYRRLNQEAAEIYEWLEENQDPQHAHGERKRLLEERGWNEANYVNAWAMRKEGQIDRTSRFIQVTPELAELVGWYLAEGSVNGKMVTFSLHLNEKIYTDRIEELVHLLGFRGVSHYERPAQNGRSVQIEDVLLSQLLVGMCGDGFANKRMPDVISEAEDHVMLRALSSLFKGDGCDFQTDTNRVALKLANPSLILEVRRLLLSFGLIGGVIREEPTEASRFRTTAYHLNYNGKSADALRMVLRGCALPIGDGPTQQCGLFRGGYVLLRISELEEVQTVPEVIGFQMSGDRSFCLAGVATHNTTINLTEWRDQVAQEIARWRFDNNYIPIMPLPLGNQTIGGDGKALLLQGEMQQLGEQIIMGMGVPREFLQGGLSYAGTNVSMRMLENGFISYIGRQRQMAIWIMKMVAHFMGWPEVGIRFKPFKMADDLQRKSYLLQLNQAQKISDTTLLADSDLEIKEENEIMMRESAERIEATRKQQLAMAEIQGEAQVIMLKYQQKAQQAMMAAQQGPQAPGEPGGIGGAIPPVAAQVQAQAGGQGGAAPMKPGGPPAAAVLPAPTPAMGAALGMSDSIPAEAQSLLGNDKQKPGVDIIQMAEAYATQIAQMPPQQQDQALMALEAQSPELAALVEQFIGKVQSGQAGQATSAGVDQRPLPEQLPARRQAQLV